MLIYNNKKEFIGIDNQDLNALGYSTLNDLFQECSDFAQLFVKTPGFIHDFKHVHWIDFIDCAQSSEDAKAIIQANGRTFKAVLQIEPFHLITDGDKSGYEIRLLNLRELTNQETQNISDDIAQRPTQSPVMPKTEQYAEPKPEPKPSPKPAPEPVQEEIYEPEPLQADVVEDNYHEDLQESYSPSVEEDPYDIDTKLDLDLDLDTLDEPLKAQIPQESTPAEQDDTLRLDLDDLHQDEEEEVQAVETPVETKVAPPKQQHSTPVVPDDGYDNTYVYDPHVASDELGLPIDLIEEFIQDFINQAYEFKDELYASLDNGEIDNVRILSHKLKGVAANLRIEDAFDVLVIVNTSDDVNIILLNLNRFYKIISKLAGEEVPQEPVQEEATLAEPDEEPTPVEPDPEPITEDTPLEIQEEEILAPQDEDDDDIFLDTTQDSFDEDIFDIDDSHVPEKIEIAELADDDFIQAPEMDTEAQSPLFEMPQDIEMDQNAPTAQASTYEKSAVAGELGLDTESFNILFDEFILDTGKLLEELKLSLLAEELVPAKKIAMKIKGMSDNMRITEFKNELSELISTDDSDAMIGSVERIKMKLNALSKIKD